MLNTGKYVFKVSRAEEILNFALLIQAVLIFVIITVIGFLNYDWTDDKF